MFYKILLIFIVSLVLQLPSYAKTNAVIVYAADLPIIGAAEHGDYAELATLVRKSRSKAAHTAHYFFFGGASLAPSPLASFDSGSHIVDILNMIEPDALSVTKREFSYFEDELTLRSYEAGFPFLLSNAIDKQTNEHLDGIYSQLVLTKQNFTVGIISILHPKVTEQYLLQRVEIIDPEKTVKQLAQSMREKGADFIVLMHSDHFPFIETMLEQTSLNLAIQSEPHDREPATFSATRHPHRVLIESLGTAAIIQVDEVSGEFKLTVELVELATQAPDPDVKQAIASYKSRLASQLERPVGKTMTSFQTTRSSVRTKENAFANLITDAMKKEANTQAALINAGTVRGNRQYPANYTFLYRDLLDELPFRSRMVVLEVTGAQLKLALENGVSQLESVKGRFPQVSGIRFTVSPKNSVGARISDIHVNGEPIEDNQIYSLASTDYLYQGGDGYVMLRSAKRRFDKSPTAPLISDVLARALRTNNSLLPYKDGRISFTGSQPE